MVLLAIWTSNWFQVFLFVIWFLFPTLCTCLSSPSSVPVVSKVLIFQAHPGSWDVLFDPLKTIAYFHHFRNLGPFSEDFLLLSGYPPRQESFHFLFSQRFLVLLALKLFFSIRDGENFARQTSSRDSMTIYLEKSAALFSGSSLKKFLFFI